MPSATSKRATTSAPTSRTPLRRSSASLGFEELALCTLQTLHPERQLQLSDIRISRVRRLIKQLLNGQFFRNRQHTSAKSSDLPTIVLPSPPAKKISKTNQPMPNIAKRKISVGSSVDSHDSEETKTVDRQPQSQLEQLIERCCVLPDGQATIESFGALKRELVHLFKTERTVSAQNKKQLNFLETQLLRSEIDPRRSPQKNIQCIEIHVLIELQKLRLLRELNQEVDLDKRSKVIPKLRFLNIITGGHHLANFMRETMDPEFSLSIPEQLKLVRERMCVDMPDEELQFLACSTTTDDLFPTRRLSKSGTNLTVDTPSSIESTPRNRSNSTPQSSSSAVSGFDEEDGFPTLEKMTNLGSPPSSPIALKGHVLEDLKENSSRHNKQPRLRKSSSSSTNELESKISTRRTTLNTDDDPPPLLSPAAIGTFHLPTIDQEDGESFEPPTLPKLTTRRSSRATLKRKLSIKEEESSTSRRTSIASKTTVKVPLRVDARGSIASRRQTNKRLCVIRQHTNNLMPTSRRSSTALLQKQQEQTHQTTKRRSSYFERLALEVQKQALRNIETPPPVIKDKKKTESVEVARPPPKKAKTGVTIITENILRRYRKRMGDLYQNSKQLDEHEVFYGRCNLRADLFEKEKSEADDQKPSTSTPTNKSKPKSKSEQLARKQKNRSGHLVKANTDCLYIAHTLLNVHNNDPLSSCRPKPGTGKLVWGACGRKAATSMSENGQPFRIRRLVRHANRAKALKLRQFIQRSQQQQVLKRIKQEEEERSSTKEE